MSIAHKVLLRPELIKLKVSEGIQWIWGAIRKKWLVFTPEELVRQSLIQYMIQEKAYWSSHMAVEKEIKLGNSKKRFDILVFNAKTEAIILVECKAPYISINEKAAKQLLQYNLELKSKFLVLTNGKKTMVYDVQQEEWLEDLPEWSELQ